MADEERQLRDDLSTVLNGSAIMALTVVERGGVTWLTKLSDAELNVLMLYAATHPNDLRNLRAMLLCRGYKCECSCPASCAVPAPQPGPITPQPQPTPPPPVSCTPWSPQGSAGAGTVGATGDKPIPTVTPTMPVDYVDQARPSTGGLQLATPNTNLGAGADTPPTSRLAMLLNAGQYG